MNSNTESVQKIQTLSESREETFMIEGIEVTRESIQDYEHDATEINWWSGGTYRNRGMLVSQEDYDFYEQMYQTK